MNMSHSCSTNPRPKICQMIRFLVRRQDRRSNERAREQLWTVPVHRFDQQSDRHSREKIWTVFSSPVRPVVQPTVWSVIQRAKQCFFFSIFGRGRRSDRWFGRSDWQRPISTETCIFLRHFLSNLFLAFIQNAHFLPRVHRSFLQIFFTPNKSKTKPPENICESHFQTQPYPLIQSMMKLN